MHDGRIYDVVRDLHAESDVLDQLRQLGFLPVSEVVHVYYQHAHSDDFALREGGGANYSWLDFVTQEVPRLREAGWLVEIDTDFPLQIVRADAEIDAELVEGSGIDWLELNLGVKMDGERVDLIPPWSG